MNRPRPVTCPCCAASDFAVLPVRFDMYVQGVKGSDAAPRFEMWSCTGCGRTELFVQVTKLLADFPDARRVVAGQG
jgi:hypothetical protein